MAKQQENQPSQEQADLWRSSLYDFVRYWTVAPAEYLPKAKQTELHAKLTESGLHKLRTRQADKEIAFHAGKDYCIQEADDILLQHKEYRSIADAAWVPMEENTFTNEYRHDWIYQRNIRPVTPTFDACPMPRHDPGQQNENAALVMTYFHPWSLNPDAETQHVPFLGNLCTQQTWHESMLHWFDGRVLRYETKLNLDNFLAVTRTRPQDDTIEEEEEEFSDTELHIGPENFSEILKTQVGAGRAATEENEEPADEASEARAAFDIADVRWSVPAIQGNLKQPEGSHIRTADLEKGVKAALASQKQEYAAAYPDSETNDPSIQPGKAYSAEDVWRWYARLQQRKDENGQPEVKKKQLEMLEIVCSTLVSDLQAQNADVPLPEPLMWLLHGGPGTGKSEVCPWLGL